MRIVFVFLVAACLFFSCNSGDNTPDVSNIKIELESRHFEKDLFTLDTADYSHNLDILIAKYPSFGENFLSAILNSDPTWSSDSTADYVHGFTTAYKLVYDTSLIVFKDFAPYEKEIRQGLQFVKHYFPNYKNRKKLNVVCHFL